jgi:hypothetical protein
MGAGNCKNRTVPICEHFVLVKKEFVLWRYVLDYLVAMDVCIAHFEDLSHKKAGGYTSRHYCDAAMYFMYPIAFASQPIPSKASGPPEFIFHAVHIIPTIQRLYEKLNQPCRVKLLAADNAAVCSTLLGIKWRCQQLAGLQPTLQGEEAKLLTEGKSSIAMVVPCISTLLRTLRGSCVCR